MVSLRAYMEELSASFNTQNQGPDDSYSQDRRCAPCILVDIPHEGRQVLAKLHTKQDISHFFLQLGSQDSAQELFRHTISPYLGVSRIEFQFCCLRTRFVSQGVFCLHSVGFGGSWTFTMIFLNVFRGYSRNPDWKGLRIFWPGEPGNCARTGRFGGEGEQVRKRARKMQNSSSTQTQRSARQDPERSCL